MNCEHIGRKPEFEKYGTNGGFGEKYRLLPFTAFFFFPFLFQRAVACSFVGMQEKERSFLLSASFGEISHHAYSRQQCPAAATSSNDRFVIHPSSPTLCLTASHISPPSCLTTSRYLRQHQHQLLLDRRYPTWRHVASPKPQLLGPPKPHSEPDSDSGIRLDSPPSGILLNSCVVSCVSFTCQ